MSDFIARIIADLDTSKVSNAFKAIQNTKITLDNIKLGSSALSNLQKQFKNIKFNIDIDGDGTKGIKKTVSEINNDYKDLMDLQKKINSIRFQLSGLDELKDSAQIKELSGQLNHLMTDYNNLYNTCSKSLSTDQIDNLTKAFDKTSDKIAAVNSKLSDTSAIKQTESAYKELYNISKQIGNLEFKIKGLDSLDDISQIKELNGQLDSLRKTYDELMSSFAGGLNNSNLTIGQLQNLNQVFSDTQNKLKLLDSKVEDTQIKFAKGIKLKLETNEFSKDISNVESKMSKLSKVSDELSSDVNKLKQAFSDIKASESTGNINGMISSYREYEVALKSVTNQLKEATNTQKTYVSEQERIVLSNQMDIWLQRNSAAAQQFGNRIESLKAELKECDAIRFKSIQSEFKQLTQEAELAGKTGKDFKDTFQQVFDVFSSAYIIQKTFDTMKQGVQDVIDLDTALIDLKKTADATATQLNDFYFKANDVAKELGSSTREVIQVAADWNRLGYNMQDSMKLSEYSSIFSTISGASDLTIDQATEGMVSIMKAFGMETDEVLDGIISKINELGNRMAVSNSDVVEAMRQSSSAMAAANNSFDKTAALAVAGIEVVRNSSTVGSALKTISMRIRGYDEETEQLSDGLRTITGDIADLTKTASSPNGISLFTDATKQTYKDTYDILQEISRVWDELSDKNQAQLLEVLFGKNRAQVGAAIIQNFEAAEKSMQYMADSAGSAMDEMEVAYGSIDYKLNKLRETGVGIWQNLFDRGEIGAIVESLTGVLNILDAVTESFGLFGTIAIGGFTVLAVKAVKDIVDLGGGLKNLGDIIAGITTSLSGANPILLAITGITTALGVGFAAYNKFAKAGENARKKLEETKASYDDITSNLEDVDNQLKSTNTRIDELNSKENKTFVEESELQKLKETSLQLEIQKKLLEEQQKISAKQLNEDAINAYNKNIGKYNYSEEDIQSYVNNAKATGNNAGLLFEEKNIAALIAGMRQFKELREEALALNTDEGYQDASHYSEILTSTKEQLLENLSELQDYKEQFESIPESFRTEETNANLKKVQEQIKAIYMEIDPNGYKQLQFENLFSTDSMKKVKDELVEMAKASDGVGIKVRDIPDKLAAAANESGITIAELVRQINDLAGVYDVDYATSVVKNAFKDSGIEKTKEDIEQFNSWFDSLSEEDKIYLYEVKLSSDTSEWDENDWREKLNNYKNGLEDCTKVTMSFNELMSSTEDGSFNQRITSYRNDITTLETALEELNAGNFSNSDIADLILQFPELASETDNLGTAIEDMIASMDEDMISEFNSQIENMDTEESRASLENLRDVIMSLREEIDDLNIDEETQRMSNLFAAISESNSSTGLSSTSITNIQKMFDTVKGYDFSEVFKKTANGVDLNTDALRRLQHQYEQQQLEQENTKLKNYTLEYERLTEQINHTTDAKEREVLISQRDSIEEKIQKTSLLITQYEGLTSAFSKWEQAQNISEDGAKYDSLATSLTSIKDLYDKGLVGTEKFRAAVQLMTNEDLSTANIDKLVQVYNSNFGKISSYVTEGREGIDNFLSDVHNLHSEWVNINEDGSWNKELKFSVQNADELAAEMNLNVETVESILNKLQDYGFTINMEPLYQSLDILQSEADVANQRLIELGKTDISFTFRTNVKEDLEGQIQQATNLLDQFREKDGTINIKAEGAQEAQAVLKALLAQYDEVTKTGILTIDTSQLQGEIGSAISILQEFQNNYNNLEIQATIGADTSEAQINLQIIASQINEIPDDVKTNLGLNDEQFQAALSNILSTNIDVSAGVNLDNASVQTILSTIAAINPELLVKAGIDESSLANYIPPEKEVSVNAKVNDTEEKAYQPDKKEIPTETNVIDTTSSLVLKPKELVVTAKVIDNQVQNYQPPSNKTLNVNTKVIDSTVVDYKPIDKTSTVIFKKDSTIPDTYVPKDRKATVIFIKDSFLVDAYQPRDRMAEVKFLVNDSIVRGWQPPEKNAFLNYHVRTIGSAGVDGTAHAQGTAFAIGDWGTKKSGIALGGELGQELVNE